MNIFVEVNERLGTSLVSFYTEKNVILRKDKSNFFTHPVVLFLDGGSVYVSTGSHSLNKNFAQITLFYIECKNGCRFTKTCSFGSITGMALSLFKGLYNSVSKIKTKTHNEREIFLSLGADKFRKESLENQIEKSFVNIPHLSASDFQRAKRITCVRCSNILIPNKNIKYKDKPSEHWNELMGLWSCCKNEFVISEEVEFEPTDAFIVVSQASISVLRRNTKNIKEESHNLHCLFCDLHLGVLSEDIYLLDKPSLALQMDDVKSVKCTWKDIIRNELIYYTNFCSNYHFSIKCNQTNEITSFSILTTDARISTGHSDLKKTIKIRYTESNEISYLYLVYDRKRYNELKKEFRKVADCLPSSYHDITFLY